ncbi:STP1 protein [Plasmodium ovale]|uniref:STP1 protein n=1 Tax=Plasmodium ovale TaxID=36330 RepID=A0A1D3JDH7_PLAOA|nr:STP1 protein [Plasmodium ovale]
MKKFTHTCNEIKKATKKDTHNVYIRYKTPILQGAINIINEFSKDKNDGIHYKNLCEELNKYVKSQRKCVREEVLGMGKNFVTREWNIIQSALGVTFKSQKVNRLCYLDNDKEINQKKYILDLHELFRNFCIQKKERLQNTSEVDFQKCSDYMSWIEEKKREIQGRDPNYDYIRQYEEYFYIHHNCNYPWLLNGTPDIICRMTTKTRAKENQGKEKSLGDTTYVTPVITHDSSKDNKKNEPQTTQPSSKGDVVPADVNSPNPKPEKSPTQSKSSPEVHANSQNNIFNTILEGSEVSQSTSISKAIPDDEHLQHKSIFYSLTNNLVGHKIPHYIHHSTNIEPEKIFSTYPTKVEGKPIVTPIIKQYKFIPPELLRSQQFFQRLRSQGHTSLLAKEPFIPLLPRSQAYPPSILDPQPFPTIIPSFVNYFPTTKSMKKHAPFRLLPPIPKYHPGTINNYYYLFISTKKIETVLIQPATPDASYFRSPFMIYTLIFLTIVAIIGIFYLFSKKRRLKRHLKINKLPEEVPQFDTIDSYSINNVSYENKTHDDNNMYSNIKIQKGIINKNTSLPKRKKKKRKAIIDIHMEMLNECKNDEWELNKNDFLEICLEEFIREQNKIYASSEHSNLIMKNISIKNKKEDKVALWDKWAKGYTHIWEHFKRENIFKALQNQWKEEEKVHLEKIETHNTNLNVNEKIPLIQTKKYIWKKWITKQATLMDQYKEEQWFKSLVEELKNVSDEYKSGKIKDDIFVENIKELENKENNEQLYKLDKHIFSIKVLIQILMMVIEECIKEENPEQTEVLLDNLINKLNKEKRAKIEPENIYEENMNHI